MDKAKEKKAVQKKSRVNWKNVALVTKTVIVCAIIASAVVYHLVALDAVKQKSFQDGANTIKNTLNLK